MALIAHPVVLPDQQKHTLLTAWATTCAQNLTKLLSEEGFVRAEFFFTKVLSLRPGVAYVHSVNDKQTISQLKLGNSFTVVSGLRPSSHPIQQELWLGIKWEIQAEPKELWVITLNKEQLTAPWVLLSPVKVVKEEKQIEKAATQLEKAAEQIEQAESKVASPTVKKPRKKKVTEEPQLSEVK
jgi:hypothetical protein